MEKKIVLVACGTGIATSTVVNDAVTKLAKLNNIPVEIIQCKMMEVPSYADRANLLITTPVADKSKYNFPVINARAFLTGIGLDKTKEERQTLRSKTFQGMANAFAKQWGDFVNNI